MSTTTSLHPGKQGWTHIGCGTMCFTLGARPVLTISSYDGQDAYIVDLYGMGPRELQMFRASVNKAVAKRLGE